jgi:glucose/arabinose dehydrogenase
MITNLARIALPAAIVCVGPALAEITKAPAPRERVAVKVETVAKGLANPWGLQFLPDGRMLVTERAGRMRVISKDGTLSPPIAGVPEVAAAGQGGLLDVALAPNFAASRQIYFSFSEPRGGGKNGTAVARARLAADGGRLDNVEVIFRQKPDYASSAHFGSRLAFARDGTLYVTLGERSSAPQEAQNAATYFGKVVRIKSDGSIPADNPKIEGWAPGIWSIGHRNPQSAAIHPETGKLWTVEHGARGGDEINVPAAGKNYGWPVISYGRHYSGSKIGVGTHKDGLEQPIYYWDPSIAPSGMAFYTADNVPAWKGNLFVGALAGQHLTRLVLDGEEVVAEERLLTDLRERIRDVRQGPDGALYVLTDSGNGEVLRIRPQR